MALVIFLHRTFGAGKPTLARPLQAAVPTPFWHVLRNKLRDVDALPVGRRASGKSDGIAAGAPVFF